MRLAVVAPVALLAACATPSAPASPPSPETKAAASAPAPSNSKEELFEAYKQKVIQHLGKHAPVLNGPDIAGTTWLRLDIARDGTLIDSGIAGSSGKPALDQAWKDAMLAAAPYPPFPAELPANSYRISYRIVTPISAQPQPAKTVAWSVIDCAQSDIVLPSKIPNPSTTCRESKSHGGSAFIEGGEFQEQSAAYVDASEFIFIVLQKPKNRTTNGGISVRPEDREGFLSRAPVKLVKGAAGSETVRLRSGYIKTFAGAEWGCVSFVKDSPPARAATVGVDHFLAGYYCQHLLPPASAEAMAHFLETLEVKL